MDHLDLGLESEFRLRPIYYGNTFNPKSGYDFHDFPRSNDAGWEISSPKKTDSEFEGFIQSWLFFGLISTVVAHTE